MADTTVWL